MSDTTCTGKLACNASHCSTHLMLYTVSACSEAQVRSAFLREKAGCVPAQHEEHEQLLVSVFRGHT